MRDMMRDFLLNFHSVAPTNATSWVQWHRICEQVQEPRKLSSGEDSDVSGSHQDSKFEWREGRYMKFIYSLIERHRKNVMDYK